MSLLKRILPIFLIIVFLIISSCSHTTKKNIRPNLASEQSLEKALSKLELLVADAKKNGEEAIHFLSSDLFFKANDASMRGDAVTASLIFRYVVELNPSDIYLRKKYAVELIRLGKLVEAKEQLAFAYKRNHKEDAIGLVLAGIHTALGEHKSAQKIYQKILSASDDFEEACVFLSKSYALEKRYSEAHKELEKCEKSDPKKAIYSYYRGKISLEQESRKDAIKYFNRAIKIDPDYHQAVIGIGLLHEEREDFDKAVVLYRKFLERNPENFTVLSRMVQLLFLQGEYDQVVPHAETLISLDPSDLNLKVRLGIIYSDNRNYQEAILLFKDVLNSVPDSDKVLYYLGALYQQLGEYSESLSYYKKINSQSQLYADTVIQITQIMGALARIDYVEGGKRGEVNEFIKYTLAKMSELKEIEVELAVSLSGYYEAIEDYPKAIDVISKYKDNEKFSENHTYYLASLFEKNRDHKQARAIVYKILEKNPENPHALNFIGYSMVELDEDYDKAYEMITKAVEIKPDDGFIRDSLGWYYYKKGNYKKALKEMKKAFELVRDDPVIAKHLAMVYRKLNKFAEAKKYYEEALKNCKMDSERADVIKSLEDLENIRMPASE